MICFAQFVCAVYVLIAIGGILRFWKQQVAHRHVMRRLEQISNVPDARERLRAHQQVQNRSASQQCAQ